MMNHLKRWKKNLSLRKKINIAIHIEGILITVISIFMFFSSRAILSKLNFIEDFDNINFSFLEMRKSEKNYFLYHDVNALKEVLKIGEKEYNLLINSKEEFMSKLGKKDYIMLLAILDKYLNTAKKIVNISSNADSNYLELTKNLREFGHHLTQFSIFLRNIQHKKVNKLVHQNAITLFIGLGIILVSQLLLWQYFFISLSKRLLKIESLTKEVANGNFHKVVTNVERIDEDEIGLLMKGIIHMANELEKREEQLIQAKKLASLGVLVSGVAHEIGNPLNNIFMLTEGYLSYYDSLEDEQKKIFMRDVREQAKRIKKIVRKLLNFSRQKKFEFNLVSPIEVVEKSIALVNNQIKVSNIKVHRLIDSNLPFIKVDVDQIQQVIVNLFINAIHAMPKGGDIFVEIRVSEDRTKVIIKVRDTGVGIKPEILPHIFDPFFTTKGTKGTGLGLSVSYGIIKQHNGKISVKTEVNKGTTFIIELPAHLENNLEEEKHA
ncbi:MAG: ATP-binding protein [Desulfonauticus sp.]|nr:ATP-binding protein [Desulfonauticus sp.]